ncbi:hypothetical protein C0J52_05718 [Blattella germanica]|nr:hypothetical protein C0J52_05718 [Blattella germanica]
MANSQVFKSLGKCEVCDDKDAKYTCPRCELKTCCIACINIHKKELECDGIRNKVFYKPLSQFTNLDLLSENVLLDYRLLEETNRCVERLVNDPSKHYTSQQKLPINLYRLRCSAWSRGTRLEFLPHNFSRSKENTTFYNWNERLIYWRIEWIFPQANNIKCVGTSNVIPSIKTSYSTTILQDLLVFCCYSKEKRHEEMEDVSKEAAAENNNLLFKSDFSDSEKEDDEEPRIKKRKYKELNIPNYDELIKQNS